MKWTLLLLEVFLIQEPISSNAIVLEAYQHGYNIWLIHLLFVAATLFDIVGGYFLGKLIHDRFAEGRVTKYIDRKANAFSAMVGKSGKRIAIIVYGPTLFPLSPFLAPWLEIHFWDALIYILIGEILLWYLLLWIIVLGLTTFIPNPAIVFYALLIISLLVVVAREYFKKKR